MDELRERIQELETENKALENMNRSLSKDL